MCNRLEEVATGKKESRLVFRPGEFEMACITRYAKKTKQQINAIISHCIEVALIHHLTEAEQAKLPPAKLRRNKQAVAFALPLNVRLSPRALVCIAREAADTGLPLVAIANACVAQILGPQFPDAQAALPSYSKRPRARWLEEINQFPTSLHADTHVPRSASEKPSLTDQQSS